MVTTFFNIASLLQDHIYQFIIYNIGMRFTDEEL